MSRLVLILLAIFLPPLAVFFNRGISWALLINIILCIFFYVPGIIHAVWLVTKPKDPSL